MVIETDVLTLWEWLFTRSPVGPIAVPRLLMWFVVMFVLFFIGMVVAFISSATRFGPIEGGRRVAIGFFEGLADLFHTSPRRVAAMTWLAYKESIRRKVLWAFGIFILLLLFAGWFLDSSGSRPAEVYLNFVMFSTLCLVLVLAVVLSTFSLPKDISDRTIFTIVSKPVRRQEIVLGRMLGFTATGTVLLALMGAISFVFVLGGLNHDHRLRDSDLLPVTQRTDKDPILAGRTQKLTYGHNHEVKIYPGPDGKPAYGATDNAQGHFHEITVTQENGKNVYAVGPSQGLLMAREARYGKLTFRDRAGQEVPRGINVGNEWEYRSYIEGGTKAAAVWHFSDINERDFPSGLPIELALRVFRTYKGRDIKEAILGSIVLRNPNTKRATKPLYFECREYFTDVKHIPREVYDTANQPLDLFRDIVHDGKVDVEISCAMPSQYFGMAQYDVYLRVVDHPFWLNFIKGYFGIWTRMVLVICFGVMFSTFLRGSVAMLATMAAIVGGLFMDFMQELAQGALGPMVAMKKIVTHQNEVLPLEPGMETTFLQTLDAGFLAILNVTVWLLPNLGKFSFDEYVSHGFDVPLMLAPGVISHLLTMFAYLVPMFLVAHYAFRAREVAQ